MPLRERMRKAFGRRPSSSGPDGDLTPKRTRSQKAELYKPGEIMPKPKYPGRYNKPHQDMLKQFSFKDAWIRRKSEQSGVSPMHSRATSRKSSFAGPSGGGAGGGAGGPAGAGGGGRKSTTGHRPGSVGRLAEDTDSEDDVLNVGLSRQATADQSKATPNTKTHRPSDPALEDSAKAMSTADSHTQDLDGEAIPAATATATANGHVKTNGVQPDDRDANANTQFTQDELVEALKKSSSRTPGSADP